MNGGTAMTVEEIGSNVAERLLQGAMNHQQFANYYDFLGLQGYKLCHECHFYEQNCGYLVLGLFIKIEVIERC